MELMITDGSLLNSYWIILTYVVGEFFIELMLSDSSLLTSFWIILSDLIMEFVILVFSHVNSLTSYCNFL